MSDSSEQATGLPADGRGSAAGTSRLPLPRRGAGAARCRGAARLRRASRAHFSRPAGSWQLQLPLRPGGLPLRPLGMGEIFNGAITSMRQAPGAALGSATALSAALATVSAILTLVLNRTLSGGTTATWTEATGLVLGVGVSTALACVLAVVAGRNVLGWPTTAAEAWAVLRPRVAALLGLSVLLLLIYCALWIPAAALIAVAIATGQPLVIVAGSLLGLATLAAELVLWAVLSLAAPALLLERLSPAAAIRRAWRLGFSSFWRVLGIQVLAGAIFLAVAYRAGAAVRRRGSRSHRPHPGGPVCPVRRAGSGRDRHLRNGRTAVSGRHRGAGVLRRPDAQGRTGPGAAQQPVRNGGGSADRSRPGRPPAAGLPAAGLRAARVRMLTGAEAIARAAATGGGPGISRERARQLAQRELARSIYKPSAWSRIWHDIAGWLQSLAAHGSAGRPGWLGAALLTAGVVVVLAAGVWLAGPARVNRRSRGPVVDGRPMSADGYRLAAEQHRADGDYPAAIIARFRAIAVDLERRGILQPRPGRTAAELGQEAASAIPAEASALARAARLFDDVRYGGRPGSLIGYQQLRELDLRIAATARGGGDSGRGVVLAARPAPASAACEPADRWQRPAAGSGPVTAQASAGERAGNAPPAASDQPRGGANRVRRQWRQARAWIAIGLLVVLAGVVAGLIWQQPGNAYLNPGSTGSTGARALADVLTGLGRQVTTVTRTGPAVSEATAGSTLVVTSPYYLSGPQLAGLARVRANVVLVEPDARTLAAFGTGLRLATTGAQVGGIPAACTLYAAVLAGSADMGGVLVAPVRRKGGGLSRAVLSGRRRSVPGAADRARPPGDRPRHRHPDDQRGARRSGNAALAINLLSARRIVWLVPPAAAVAAAGPAGPRSFFSLVPLAAYLVAIQLAVALLLAVCWRARRLGPLVAEPLPVVVRAAETVEGHGRLYQSRRARASAASALRTAAISRAGPAAGLASGASPEASSRHWRCAQGDRRTLSPRCSTAPRQSPTRRWSTWPVTLISLSERQARREH